MDNKEILELLGDVENTPTNYQLNFYKELLTTDKNIVVNAVAGSGKTTTIVDALRLIPINKRTIFLAFNNSIVDELKERCPSNVRVTTLHSLGWRAMLNYYDRPDLDDGKCWSYCKRMFRYKIPNWEKPYYFAMVTKLVDLMRFNLITTKEEIFYEAIRHNIDATEDMVEDAKMVYEIMVEDQRSFDFADMIFVPALNDEIYLGKYDYVFVDEAQDLNKAQFALVERLLTKSSRLITVGDKNQAVYGFAGSDIRSFNRFQERKNTVTLPLSICFRCAKEIVYRAQKIVPHIEAYEGNTDGEVREGSINEIKDGDWVLCRNVKPLVMLCVHLLKENKKARIKGSAEIAKAIIRLIEKTDQKDYKKCVKSLARILMETKRELIKQKVAKPEFHPKYIRIKEYVSVIYYLGIGVRNTDEIVEKLKRIFSDAVKGGIILSTIHRSKGLENDRVFIACPELLPSKYATQAWQLEQETNLQYVAYTRAKKSLIIINDFDDEVVDFRKIARQQEKKLNS